MCALHLSVYMDVRVYVCDLPQELLCETMPRQLSVLFSSVHQRLGRSQKSVSPLFQIIPSCHDGSGACLVVLFQGMLCFTGMLALVVVASGSPSISAGEHSTCQRDARISHFAQFATLSYPGSSTPCESTPTQRTSCTLTALTTTPTIMTHTRWKSCLLRPSSRTISTR